MSPFDFVLISLAVWRVARIIVMENGPFNAIDTMRRKLGAYKGETWWQDGIICIACVSFWLGMIAAVIVGGPWQTVILHGLAFGAVSVILMRRVG